MQQFRLLGIVGILGFAMLVVHISQVFHIGLLVFTVLRVILDKVIQAYVL